MADYHWKLRCSATDHMDGLYPHILPFEEFIFVELRLVQPRGQIGLCIEVASTTSLISKFAPAIPYSSSRGGACPCRQTRRRMQI